jgi:hypothetical protein
MPLPKSGQTRCFPAALPACVAAAGWFWGLALLAAREHQILDYYVIASAAPVNGFLALPAWKLLSLVFISVALAAACIRFEPRTANPFKNWCKTTSAVEPSPSGRGPGEGRQFRVVVSHQFLSKPVRWLLLAYVVPLLDVFRAAGLPIPVTCLEPLLLTWISGAAVAALASQWQDLSNWTSRLPAQTPQAVTGLLTVAAGTWWYLQGCAALDGFLLGYHDFGHFAFRVASTWEGRGFLLETPSLPAFWDHFNPGLALLAPLWGLWPDAKLFILLQAICLASPAPLVFRIARLWGMSASNAAVWAAAYLAFPAVGQLNLNYSYGWHPISLALPWMFAALAAVLARRFWWAAGFALLAGSFEEAVIVALACLAAALALQAWWVARRRPAADGPSDGDAALAQRLPAAGWLATWAMLTVAFVLIARYAAFTRYQTGRFENLGESGIAIALSPLLRPTAFWGEASRSSSWLFLLTLLLPWTPPALIKGRMLLLAAVFPLGLLIGWNHPPAKSIAFQYVTTLLPILLLAALAGARRITVAQPAAVPERPAVPGDWSLGLAALPWSSPTLTIMLAKSYQIGNEPTEQNPRAPGTASHQALNKIVAQINSKQSSVLASGRIAAHLLNVRRLESVEQALFRWEALCAEAGAGRTGSEVFDWIVLDTCERFQQSLDKMETILADARRAGYRETWFGDGIVVLARPPSGRPSAATAAEAASSPSGRAGS